MVGWGAIWAPAAVATSQAAVNWNRRIIISLLPAIMARRRLCDNATANIAGMGRLPLDVSAGEADIDGHGPAAGRAGNGAAFLPEQRIGEFDALVHA
jgi:hypothetical protein